jgi:hypothetical protein
VINDVVVSQEIFERLQRQAVESLANRQKESEGGPQSIEERWRKEIERMKDRQEKKIQEMTKKHQQEVHKLFVEINTLKEQLSVTKQKKAS